MRIAGLPWSIRARLTLLYAGAFLVAGIVLVVATHLILGRVLDQQLVAPLGGGAPEGLGPPGVPPLAEDGTWDGLVRQVRLHTLDAMLVASLLLVGALTATAGTIGWLIAGLALRPLRDIAATARRVADRSLHERIALSGPDDEVKELADALDAMLERLDRAFDGQRRFIANASHELRTPLTIARTLIEVALLDAGLDANARHLGATLLAVNERHARLTDDLLTLADSERAANLGAVDLAVVVGHAVAELRPLANDAGVALDVDLRGGAVLGDADRLERLARNLVENGIRHNLAEGAWVRVAVVAAEGRVDLVVENSGPTVPVQEVPGLFEPFRRLAATERLAGGSVSRGVGLGLSIVRAVAEAHGAKVEATPREDGGLLVRVLFLAAP